MENKNPVPGLQIHMTDGNGNQVKVAGGQVQPDPASPHPNPLQPERELVAPSPEGELVSSKEEKWQENHHKIRLAISTFLNDNERMPTLEELAVATKLSRRSVHNHLKKNNHGVLTQQEVEQFRMLSAKVFARVAFLAQKGDLDATKLFFQVIDKMQPKLEALKGTFARKRNPNYYIYFGLREFLVQSTIDGYLSMEEKGAIEDVLKAGLLQKEEDDEAAAEVNPDNAEDTGNRTWENNHHTILTTMCTLMKDNARMPYHTELAKATGLSRQTIARHFREFTYQPMYLAEIEQFRSLAPQLLTQVANQALDGNVKAGKLLLKLMPDLFPHPIDPTQPLDYLRLNEIILTQEMVKGMKQEYKDAISAILQKHAQRR